MKYKLKQWYPTIPKNWKVGDIISRRFSHYCHDVIGISSRILNFEEVENNPDFWEKVADYEIISFKIPGNIHWRVNLQSNGMYDGWSKDHALNELNKGIWNIYSVKRLSDGEIFSVGDKVRLNINQSSILKTINKIGIERIGKCSDQLFIYTDGEQSTLNNYVRVGKPLFTTEDGACIFEGETYYAVQANGSTVLTCIYPLSPGDWVTFATKEKAEEYILTNKPLFTTEDGVDIYLGDNYRCVNVHTFFTHNCICDKYSNIKDNNFKYFSTREKARDYVLLHKPCLSIKEIAPIFGMYHLDNSKTSLERLTEKLKDLVKSKQ